MSEERPVTPDQDCSNPKHALVYARKVLLHVHNFIGLHHAGTSEQTECEYAIQCIDRALHTLMPRAVAKRTIVP